MSVEEIYLTGEDEKQSLLKRSIFQMNKPAFLCWIKSSNPNFLEIIECNDLFLQCFNLERDEVIGNNYDFLFQNKDAGYESDNYFDYVDLIRAVKNLQITDISIKISYPKETSKSDEFKISFVPSRYNTDSIYCVFSFDKLVDVKVDDTKHFQSVIYNLERAVKNELLLREVGNIIASENLKEAADQVTKIICEYLKVDRCVLYDCINGESGFFSEYCLNGVGEISKSGSVLDANSSLKKYIDFQNHLFSDINHLKQSTTVMICADTMRDPKFHEIREIFSEFKIGSQIVTVMVSQGKIVGGIYVHQQTPRNWLIEESELTKIISNQFTIAIDRANYTNQLEISNRELEKKNEQIAKSLEHEKKLRDMQSKFVALVSHEFKTPLQIIDGARELISRKMRNVVVEDDLIDKSLVRLKSAVFRMNNLIQSNLVLSKIEMGENGIKVERQNFDIKKLIKDIIDRNSNLALERNVGIEIDIEKIPGEYFGDQKLLDHSFTNVITNAIKYSKVGTKIKILGKNEKEMLQFQVTDQGIGIPEDDIKNIGQKFFRAKNTLSVSGTGIGLYLTKYFVELHGGSVLLDSKLDIGTTIIINLPIISSK